MLFRIASDREAAKRDALEREAHFAQLQVAAEREAIKRRVEEKRVKHELEVHRRAELHEQAMTQQAELLQQIAAAETLRQQRRLRFAAEHGDDVGHHAPVFRVEQASKLLPKWDEFDIDTFIRSFERLAEANGWPEEMFLAIIQPHFSTKAQQLFLNLAAAITYNDAKEQLLLACEILPEKNNFVLKEKVTETFSDHAYNLINLFDQGQDAYENIAV